MSEPILPGPVASVLNLIYTGDNETFFTALPNMCEDILRYSGGEEVRLNYCDFTGEILSPHDFMFLPPEKEHPGPDDFMQVHVQLEAGSSIVKFIVRKDNLYLIGFCSKRGYFELRSGDRLLPTAELLQHIDVNYRGFLNIGKHDVAEMSTRFGHQHLIAAVIALNEMGTSAEDLQRHLVVVIVMLLETTRFNNIREAVIHQGLEPTKEMTLNRLNDQITDWDKNSRYVWNYRNKVESGGDPRTFVEKFGTVVRAARMIRVVHRCQDRRLNVLAPTPSPTVSKWNDPRPKQSEGEDSSKKKSKGGSSSKKSKGGQ